ncbi:hypothetical protein DBR45_59020 [Pseudomonas sp. HMWF031]|nr:hypothetical protein DBR45_59020 [Pseudomonas sp. HMWF031]
MVVNDDSGFQDKCGALELIASLLAPTGRGSAQGRGWLLLGAVAELAPLLLTPHYPPSECQKIAGR